MNIHHVMEKLEDIREELARINVVQAKMEKEIAYHIRRTDLLESKVNKVWYLVLLGAGFAMAEYGATILKLMGLIL